MREKFHGVPMLPFGILAGFAEEREIRLTDLAEEGFRFRTAEKTEEPGKFRLCFYNSLAGGYREMELTDFEMEEEEHTSFFYIYVVYTESETYRKEVRRLIGQYSRYIRLKLMEDDGELAKALTGYPAEKDLVEACSLEEQKRRWFSELPVDRVFPEFPSLALELDRPELYRKYLSMEIGEFSAWYWPSNGLGEYPLARRTPDRLYIGNSFCHLLFPEKSQLFALLEKASREGLSVTLSFSYIRDFLLESTEELLDELSAWCGQKERWLELLVNDWGLAELLRKKRSPYLEPVLGPLLNKRKKDPRLAWKTGSLESLAENSLNADFYREFLAEELGIRRYEWEIFIEIFLPKPAGSPGMNGNPVVIFRNYRKESTAFICPFTRPIPPSFVLSRRESSGKTGENRSYRKTVPISARLTPTSIRSISPWRGGTILSLRWTGRS